MGSVIVCRRQDHNLEMEAAVAGRSGLWTLVFFLHITSEIPHILVGRFAQLLPFTGSEAAASVVHMC